MAKKEEQPKPGSYIVVSPFRDKSNFDLAYSVGQDVSELNDERLSELVAAGLIEVVTETVPPTDPAE